MMLALTLRVNTQQTAVISAGGGGGGGTAGTPVGLLLAVTKAS